MRRRAWGMMLIIIILICGAAQVSGMIAAEEEEEHAAHFEANSDINSSAVHYDFIPCTLRSEEVTRAAREDAGACAEYTEPEEEWILTRETIIETAYELYGVSEEWTMWLIGTTHNEQYYDDRYLEYSWACEILNEYADRSVWELDCIWGSYYSIGNAFDGFYAADDITLQMVWEAMINRDTRIVEVDGMIRWEVPGYYLIYDSEIYNCQVWGR